MNFQFPDRNELRKRTGSMEQVCGIRRAILDDGKGRGMRVFDVTTGGGLAFTVYPDRGLDIGPATFRGLPIAWVTCNGAVAPAFYDDSGFEWLRAWCGGLLTTAGLLNAGGPCQTADGAQGLHGRQSAIPAEEVNTRAFWQEDGRYCLEITGVIRHTKVFGENLVTRRTIRTYLGAASLSIEDVTENAGSAPSPYMRLYHMNFGWPLVSEKAHLKAPPHKVTPQHSYGPEAEAAWPNFSPPAAGVDEEVYYHDLPTDKDGYAAIVLENPDLGLTLKVRYRKAELPYLVQWKMTGEGTYVLGLEPGNCVPEGRNVCAQKGILKILAPGESVSSHVEVSLN